MWGGRSGDNQRSRIKLFNFGNRTLAFFGSWSAWLPGSNAEGPIESSLCPTHKKTGNTETGFSPHLSQPPAHHTVSNSTTPIFDCTMGIAHHSTPKKSRVAGTVDFLCHNDLLGQGKLFTEQQVFQHSQVNHTTNTGYRILGQRPDLKPRTFHSNSVDTCGRKKKLDHQPLVFHTS